MECIPLERYRCVSTIDHDVLYTDYYFSLDTASFQITDSVLWIENRGGLYYLTNVTTIGMTSRVSQPVRFGAKRISRDKVEMKWNRGFSVWQKLKDFFSQILGSLWKGHNKRLRGHTIDKTATNQNHKEPDRTIPDGITYLKRGTVLKPLSVV